jgi:uncharacterized delta-60 repeat protein
MNRTSMGKVLAVALATVVLGAVGQAQAGGGSHQGHDPSFGTGGRFFSNLPQSYPYSEFLQVAPMPEGRVAVSLHTERSSTPGATPSDTIELRESDGALDPAFGSGGEVTTGTATAMVADTSGRIVYGAGSKVTRLLPDGSPDPSFGTDGSTTALPITIYEIASAPNGDIVVAGETPAPGPVDPYSGAAVIRLLPDGALDPSFGQGGVATIFPAGESRGSTAIDDLAVLPDGSVLTLFERQVVRLGPEGSLTTTFGKEGTVAIRGSAHALAGFPDGGFAVAMVPEHKCCKVPPLEVLRFDADGHQVSGFHAVASRLFGTGTQMLATADGGLVVGGVAETHANPGPLGETHVLLYRLDAAGAPVASFGEAGVADVTAPSEPQLLPNGSRLRALAQAPSGNLLIAGSDGNATLVARTEAGAPVAGFGDATGAVQESSRIPSATRVAGIVGGPHGRVLVSVGTTAAAVGRVPGVLPLTSSGRVPGGLPAAGYFRAPANHLVRSGADGLFALRHDGGEFFISHFGESGRPDSRYGQGGEYFVPRPLIPIDYAVGPKGAVTVFGVREGHLGMAALRLTPSGRPDPKFGRRGISFAHYGPGRTPPEAGVALPDGGVVLLGVHRQTVVLLRLDADGRRDRAFGKDGWVTTPVHDAGRRMKLVREGSSFVAAVRVDVSGAKKKTELIRIGPRGGVDRSFGHGGTATVGGSPTVALLADHGDTIVVSKSREPGAVVQAYLPNGRPDRAFGRGGSRVLGRGQKLHFRPAGAIVQGSGRILVAGTAGNSEGPGSRAAVFAVRGPAAITLRAAGQPAR